MFKILYILIIASFFFVFDGCGYKASPYYEEKAPKGDKDVTFIIKKKEFDTNESCE